MCDHGFLGPTRQLDHSVGWRPCVRVVWLASGMSRVALSDGGHLDHAEKPLNWARETELQSIVTA